MKVFMNQKYYVGIPSCSQEAVTLIVYLLKSVYKKELKNARICNTNKKLEVGVLRRRTI